MYKGDGSVARYCFHSQITTRKVQSSQIPALISSLHKSFLILPKHHQRKPMSCETRFKWKNCVAMSDSPTSQQATADERACRSLVQCNEFTYMFPPIIRRNPPPRLALHLTKVKLTRRDRLPSNEDKIEAGNYSSAVVTNGSEHESGASDASEEVESTV